APAALTVSVRVTTPSGGGTVTVSVAPTTLLPDRDHCSRLPFCQLSSTTEDGRLVEQYGVWDSPAAHGSGYAMGLDAEWWSVVVYTGHSMVLMTITNTPDGRGELPATPPSAPLGERVTALAADPRLAVFDPPRPATP